MSEYEPRAKRVSKIREQVSEERWEHLVTDALRRVDVLERVSAERKASGRSWHKSLEAAEPEVPWPTYVNWKRKHKNRKGEPWERSLDRRLPPPPAKVPAEIRQAACLLRRADRSVSCERARDLLVAQFGEAGRISDSSPRRIWSAAGLEYESPLESVGKVPVSPPPAAADCRSGEAS